MTAWIKCSERMPEREMAVMYFAKGAFGDSNFFIGYYQGQHIWRVFFGGLSVRACDVTHWMPLPEDPGP